MMVVSIPHGSSGRIAQKRRTHDALVAAARALVASGVTPTVEQAAAAASVSRTTAYRYFSDQRSLLSAAHPETGAESLLPPDPPTEADARLGAVMDQFIHLIIDTESQQRTMLRLSLAVDNAASAAALPLRQGRAIGWIAEALAPLQGELTEAELRRLVLAIRSATGIEALVWLTDVAGLSRDEAAALMAWSAQALLHFAMAHSPTQPTSPLSC